MEARSEVGGTVETDPLSWGRLIGSWDVSLPWAVICAVALVAYVLAFRSARGRDPASVRVRWLVQWVAGLAALAIAVQSGLDRYATSLLWMHMVQHLALIMVVPALLVRGHPLTVLEAAVPRARWRHSDTARILMHPLIGFAVYVIVIFSTHLTSFIDVSTSRADAHLLEQALYVVAGMWFLWPLISTDLPQAPHPLVRIGTVFVAMMPDAVVGIVLMQSSTVLAPDVATHRAGWGPEPLRDQLTAGGIMWVFGDSLMMFFALLIVLAFIADRARNSGAGAWLEGVRHSSLIGTLEAHGVDTSKMSDADHLDADEAALEAYNSMLRRLDDGPRRG